MTQDQYRMIYEARILIEGVQHLFNEMEDRPMEFLQPFEMVLILQPVTDRLNQVLQDRREVA